ncbi:DUF3105 domain-containing protein [Agromyces soli]
MNATPDRPSTQPSTKQQRQAARDAKLAEFRAEEARRTRTRKIAIGAGIVAVVAVIGLLVTSLVLAPKPASYTAGDSSGAKIEGVETFDYQGGVHVAGPVEYAETPPAGGDHNQVWLNCGVYEQPVPNENAVHSLEHGAVWVTYDPAQVSADELAALETKLPSSYVVLSPYDDLGSPIVLSAWNAQLKLDDPADPRVTAFFEEYWQSQYAPEPGALCTGALDAPGKVS